MVTIEGEVRLVNCSDGRIKKEYLLSGPVTRELAGFCRDFGGVRVIEGLNKPFFTFLIADCLNIKGFIGEPTVEVWFYPACLDAGEKFVSALVAASESGNADEALREEHRKLLALITGSKT